MTPPERPRDEDGLVEGREEQYNRPPPVYSAVPVLPVTYSTIVHVLGAALVTVVAYLSLQVFLNTGRLTALEAIWSAHSRTDDERNQNLQRAIDKVASDLASYEASNGATRDRANDKQDLAIGLLNQRFDNMLRDMNMAERGTIMRENSDGSRRRQ